MTTLNVIGFVILELFALGICGHWCGWFDYPDPPEIFAGIGSWLLLNLFFFAIVAVTS